MGIMWMNPDMMKQLSHVSVLYVEDEPSLRRNVGGMLGLLFETVHLAKDGQEALEMMEAYHPDLLITDVQMPVLGGIGLVKKLREQGDQTPVIILSAHAEVDDMLEAIELSLVRYLIKPITETKLVGALEKFLTQRTKKEHFPLAEGWGVDFLAHVVHSPDGPVPLTKKESKFLKLLLSKKSMVGYDEIEEVVWEGEFMSQNALRLLAKNLRKKLPDGALKNTQGLGYLL